MNSDDTSNEPPSPAVDPAGADAVTRIDRVGETLRRVFDDAAAEPLPRAFEDLLRKLR